MVAKDQRLSYPRAGRWGFAPRTTYLVGKILLLLLREEPGQSYLIVAAAVAVTRTRPWRVKELLCRDPRFDTRASLLNL
jgi:hypothetical protein